MEREERRGILWKCTDSEGLRARVFYVSRLKTDE